MIFMEEEFISFSSEYSVVVFPDPVGPTIKNIPLGNVIMFRSHKKSPWENPNSFNDLTPFDRSKILTTKFSPKILGCVEILKSIVFPAR
jgi:hypothetical protein